MSYVKHGFSNEGFREWYDDAHQEGFTDPKQMAFDTVSGALLAGAGQGLENALTLPRGGWYVTASAREEHAVIAQSLIPAYKSVADAGKEIVQQRSDDWLEDRIYSPRSY